MVNAFGPEIMFGSFLLFLFLVELFCGAKTDIIDSILRVAVLISILIFVANILRIN